jgi:predicted nucleotide-binding protein (sugar kinase/HSP70/actin superfamily)
VEQRPLVGIAGDIYTRQNAVANNDLVHRLEELGCEVWPAPFFIEQIDFSFGKNIRSAFQSVHLPRLAGISALELRRQFARWKVERLLERPEKRFIEPGYGRLRELASPYFDGEAEAVVQLNLAKMADYANRGADGILNVICFNCMLGTVSAAVAERLRKEFGPLPLTTLVFSGSGQGSEQVRLEAFVYQVQRLAAKRRPTPNVVA